MILTDEEIFGLDPGDYYNGLNFARAIESAVAAKLQAEIDLMRVSNDKLVHDLDAAMSDVKRLRYLDENSTFFDVDPDFDTEGRNIPVLASVSKRIWYHATDDMTNYPLSAVASAAMKGETP